jgi:hypothetical protein
VSCHLGLRAHLWACTTDRQTKHSMWRPSGDDLLSRNIRSRWLSLHRWQRFLPLAPVPDKELSGFAMVAGCMSSAAGGASAAAVVTAGWPSATSRPWNPAMQALCDTRQISDRTRRGSSIIKTSVAML